MAANYLMLNNDKTHVMVFGKKSMTSALGDVSINTGNHTITPTNKETLLGGHIEQ